MSAAAFARRLAVATAAFALAEGEGPGDVEEALSVQAAAAAGRGIGAWKVALRDGRPLAAPIWADICHAQGGVVARPFGPMAGIEIEIALRLGRDLPFSPDLMAADVLAAADMVLVGAEIVGGRLLGTPPFPAFLADRMANDGFVAGAGVAPLPGMALGGRRCRVWVGGRLVHDGLGGHPAGDPMLPLLAYAQRGGHPLGPVRAGQTVTTGSLCGVISWPAGEAVEAEVDGIGRLAFRAA
ncbi:MAG: hypothetical protein OHK0024_17850 [Thalassobaculales bacterium]